jgi:hypothetical protein
MGKGILRAILVAVASFQVLTGADLIVTGVSNGSGVRTRLTVTNRSETVAVLKIRLIGTGLDAVEKPIPALGTLIIPDVPAEWGLSDWRGVLIVSLDQPAVVVAHRYIDVGEGGRAGSALPVVDRDELLKPPMVGDFLWAPASAALDLYTAQANTEVDVSVWDASGNRLGSRNIKSDEAWHRLELSSLVAGDWTGVRLEVKVKAGRAALSLDVPDPNTGRWATVAPIIEGMEGRDLQLAPAYHAMEVNGLHVRTDLRLFNPGRTAARITAQLGEQQYTVDIAAKATLQVEDVLAAWFGIQDPAQGVLRIQSTLPVIASARTTGGESFELRRVSQTPSSASYGTPALLGGLRGPASRKILGLLAGPLEVTADLTLTDTQGQLVAKTTLNLAAGEWRQDALDDLFAGVSIPDDTTLEVRTFSGPVDAMLLSVDNVAGDVDLVEPQVLVDSPVCAQPVISNLNALPRNLPAAGDVRFYWATRQADSVAFVPLAESVPASGERTVRVTQTSAFQLVARNACGETSAIVSVSVGAPVLRSITAVGATAPGSGEPGQLFTLALDNLGDRSRLTAMILRSANQLEIRLPIVSFDDAGVPYGRIPLLVDSTAPSGYRTGAFTISAEIDGVETATIPLTIRPMAQVDDPVGAMRTLLDGLAAARLAPASDAERDAFAVAAGIDTGLRQLLNEIAASGQGTLRYATAAAGTVIVRRADLAAIIALNRNLLAQSESPVVVAAGIRAAASGVRAIGTCIDDKMPHMKACRDKEHAEKALWLITDPHPQVFNNEELDKAFEQGRDAAVRYLTKKLQESALNAVLGRLKLILNWTNLVCALQPIRLDGFDVRPRQFDILKTGYGTPTELWALFVPKYKQNEVAQKLEAEEAKKVMDQVPKKYDLLKPLIEPEVKTYVHAVFGDLDSDIAAWIKKNIPSLQENDSKQVGKCDIARFYASLNGPQEDKYDPKKAVLIPVGTDRADWGRDLYIFQGKRKGPETMCIRPFGGKFLLSPNQLERFKSHPELVGNCEFPGGVGVGGKSGGTRLDLIPTREIVHVSEISVRGTPTLSVTSATANAWCFCDDQAQSGIILPGVMAPAAPVTGSGQYQHSFKWRKSAAVIEVRKFGESRWEIDLSTNAEREVINQRVQFHDALAQVRVNFTNPANRENTHTIALTVTQKQGCQRPASFSGFVSGETGGSTNIIQNPTNPFQPFKRYYTGFERGQIQFNLGGELRGFETVTTSCKLSAVLELLDGPPPE